MGSARNRRKRERRRRKRQEQRHYRRLSRVVDVAPKVLRRPPPGQPKMSDTLVAFAEPLLDCIPDGAPVEAYEAELILAALVWNFIVTLDHEYESSAGPVPISEERVGKILDALSLGTDMSDDEALDLLQTLAARKHDLYPDERRLVGDVRAEFRGDRLHVVTLSTLPR
jgi:hypothetical protein